MAMSKGFRVLEKSRPPAPHSVLLEHRNLNESLLFESHAIAVLSTAETDAIRRQYVKLVDAYGCLGVLQLNAGESVCSLYLVVVTGCVSVGRIADTEVFRITQTQFVALQASAACGAAGHSSSAASGGAAAASPSEDRIADVRKVLNSGTFYFSASPSGQPGQSPSGGHSGAAHASPVIPFDLTLCAQRRQRTAAADTRFFWNRQLHTHPLRFGVRTERWLLRAMCGSVEIRTVYAGSRQARAAIVSRLSCERAGTRFNVRGTNDDGHVANFVETEQVIYADDAAACTSYVQTRGSVPLFWEQPGVQVGSHRVRMSRGPEATRPAFERHFELLAARYGPRMAIVNLLGTSQAGARDGESMLGAEFQRAHRESRPLAERVPHVVFDYHQECRSGGSAASQAALGRLRERLRDLFAGALFGAFYAGVNRAGPSAEQRQRATIRTNCLDCLDRTNCVQQFIGLTVLAGQLRALRLDEQQHGRFEEAFRQMWLNNGNEVSKIYAGTGAIQGASKLLDGARSAARTIQNNLLDVGKQEAIDVLLLGSTLSSELADRARALLAGNVLHAPAGLLREMCARRAEFVHEQPVRIVIGTYNVMGGKHFRFGAAGKGSPDGDRPALADWLLDAAGQQLPGELLRIDPDQSGGGRPEPLPDDQPADVVAIGFQEIVDLNAGNIMAASSETARAWAGELQRVLSRDRPYALLTYQQLVGVCLFVFVRAELVGSVRDVAVDSVKTGLGGATGNKGATAVRFVLGGTSMCFVAAHFAAGQSQWAERNGDYAEIARRLAFPMGRTLAGHDWVFWCGDFNYRVDMDRDELRQRLRTGLGVPRANSPDAVRQLDELLRADQLCVQREAGAVFGGYREGAVRFAPTYKYDVWTDVYDTSEKQRAPAWTDRVLWRRRRGPTDGDASTDGDDEARLRFYGRAELVHSDHRPVVAVLDVPVARIDGRRRERVFEAVVAGMGPPDATVLVRRWRADDDDGDDGPDGDDDEPLIYDERAMAGLIGELSRYGEVTLVRLVGRAVWMTFRDGRSALEAAGGTAGRRLTLTGEPGELNVWITLRTRNWSRLMADELALCTPNTVPLCGDDEPPADGGASGASGPPPGDFNALGIPVSGGAVPRRPPPPSPKRPMRPALPPGGVTRPAPPIPVADAADTPDADELALQGLPPQVERFFRRGKFDRHETSGSDDETSDDEDGDAGYMQCLHMQAPAPQQPPPQPPPASAASAAAAAAAVAAFDPFSTAAPVAPSTPPPPLPQRRPGVAPPPPAVRTRAGPPPLPARPAAQQP